MDEAMQFFWAMVDAAQAAMIGLNLVPVIVTSLVTGLAVGGRHYLAKTVVAALLAFPIAALWPMVYGMGAIWPDPVQIETQIQIGIVVILAWAIVRTAGALKSAAAHATERKTAKA